MATKEDTELKTTSHETNGHTLVEQLADQIAAKSLLPPLYRGSSGLYVWRWPSPQVPPRPIPVSIPMPIPIPEPLPRPGIPPLPGPGPDPAPLPAPGGLSPIPIFILREELRLDVDGRYPQMVASGTTLAGLAAKIQWIANLHVQGADHWSGSIWYKDGATATFPYTTVDIHVVRGFLKPASATVTFTGGGAQGRTLTYPYVSPYFHPIEFEYDCAEGTSAVTTIQTGAHPDRPASLPSETLTLSTVYQRAGFEVKNSGGSNIVPLSLSGADAKWSNQEMHDAMQVYWSRFAPKAQWSVWVFFAALHEMGTSLGGIMFDDIGPNQRQGTAIFEDSFIQNAPPGDPNPAAWVQRMRFWTAAHEMGHTFNLAHSWQKSLGTPWIPLADEPGAFSFMNYPYRVPPGPQDVFFRQFEYRFSNSELLFMRHAPLRFVEQGNALWFDDHGFQGANVNEGSPYRLQVRVNRARPVLQFMEPAVVELKLTNASSDPVLIPENLLAMQDRMSVVIKKAGRPARQYLPYARYCFVERKAVLHANESVYESLFLGAGRNGWDLAEPGDYTVQVALHLDGEDIVSNPLRLRVTPPRGYDEEALAQDFFSDDVGRVLNFDGSGVLTRANDVLQLVTERLPDRRVTVHARVALGNSVATERKRLQLGEGTEAAVSAFAAGGRFVTLPADETAARKQLTSALMAETKVAAETLGHIDYKDYAVSFAEWLSERGDSKDATSVLNELYQTLSDRKVLERVLEQIKALRDGVTENRGKSVRRSRPA